MTKAASVKTTDPLTGGVLPLAPPDAPCALRVVGEPVELRLSLGTSQFTLGAARPADCLLARKHISRRHATIVRDGLWLAIEDVSKNGCRFGGAIAKKFFVRAGNVFVAGETSLMVLDARLRSLRGRLCWQLGYANHAAVDAALVAVAGPSQPPLLLTGPVGFGPERLARAIHTHSWHRELPFVTINARAPRKVVETELARAGAGAVCVDLRGVRRAGAALVDNLFRTSARVITFADDARAMRYALDWHGFVAEIRSPAIAERPPGEALAMLDVALAEQESMHRVTAPGPLCELLGPARDALARFDWPENHDDLRRAATRLSAWADAGGGIRAAARSLGVHSTTLREALCRLGILAPKARGEE